LAQHEQSTGTFRNPVYGRPFADPMVLKFNGRYYAYGTPKSGGLPVLRSTDLTNWEQAGEVLAPPDAGLAHWAPEVAYDNGRFFLYYSTGGHEGENQQLRIASGVSTRTMASSTPTTRSPSTPIPSSTTTAVGTCSTAVTSSTPSRWAQGSSSTGSST
jgi:beta-xylosidase